MTTSLFKVSRAASASLSAPRIAAAPSNGVYFAAPNTAGDEIQLARINSDGSINWSKNLSTAGSLATGGAQLRLVSSAANVALVMCYWSGTSDGDISAVALFNSAGTLQWGVSLPLRTLETGGHRFVWMDSSSNLYLAGANGTSSASRTMVRLGAASGALDWAVETRGTLGSTSGSGPAGQLSGGDLVMMTSRTSGAPFTAYIQRRSSSTGAVVWTTGVSITDATSSASTIAIDPSDNIYVIGREWFAASATGLNSVFVVKLDSSGALLWSRMVSVPSALGSSSWGFFFASRAVATAAGVMIPGTVGAGDSFGHLFVDAAGTIGTGVVNAITYAKTTGVVQSPSASNDGSTLIATLQEGTAPTYALVYKADTTGSADDATFGSWPRVTQGLNLVSATSSITSPGFTALTLVTPTVSAQTFTDTAGDVVVTTYAPTIVATATGLPSSAAFGLPVLQGLMLPFTVSTAFGAATHVRVQPATALVTTQLFGLPRSGVSYSAAGLAPTLAFGLPARTFNTTRAATAIDLTSALGQPTAFRGSVPEPVGLATALDAPTAFGLPARTAYITASATGFSSTAFGVVSLKRTQAASGLASTAFGAAASKIGGTATGLTSQTAFGRAQTSGVVMPSGFSTTIVGSPAARARFTGTATGWSSTQVPSIGAGPARRVARGARFRQAWGQAQAERFLA